jgi:PAS domain S-box-containing protein
MIRMPPARAGPDLAQGILDTLEIGAALLDERRRVLSWNAWLGRASRITALEALGRDFVEIFPQVAGTRLAAAIEDALAIGASSVLTHALNPGLLPLQRSDRSALRHGVAVLPMPGGPRTCLVQVTDVTASVEREHALRLRQDARFRAVVDTALDTIVTTTLDGRIEWVNPAAERQFGRPTDGLVGQDVGSLLAEDGSARWIAATSWPGASAPFEVEGRHADGTAMVLEVSVARWAVDGHAFVTGVLRDATARKRAEAATAESEARLRLAQELTGIGTWEWAPETGELLWTPEQYALYGLDPLGDGPMTDGRFLAELVHPDDRGRVRAYLRNAMAGGGTQEVLFRASRRRPEGGAETCWMIARARSLPRADGTPARMLGATVDITERQRTEARLQELQAELLHVSRISAAGEMASALAHELNQPLTAVASALSAAQRLLQASPESGAEAPELVHEAMERAIEQSLRAGQIVRRLREFVTPGEADPRPEKLPALIEAASTLALVGTRERGIQVTLRLDGRLPPVLVDRVQFQQVLLNLIRNAVEAMADGCGQGCDGSSRRELTISAAQVGPDRVEVAVADTGPGLAPEIAERLFQPFVSSKPGGMGVGLSISRSIIEAHGGRLQAEARAGGGTVFRFTVPTAPRGTARRRGGGKSEQ